jgi:DNA-binding PadR family transcriptional regulator
MPLKDAAEMRQPADELIILLSHGMEGWMLGTTTDAVEIATFAVTTGNRAIPRTPDAVEQLLEDMVEAGLVEHCSRQPNKNRLAEIRGAYGLTEGGWVALTSWKRPSNSRPYRRRALRGNERGADLLSPQTCACDGPLETGAHLEGVIMRSKITWRHRSDARRITSRRLRIAVELQWPATRASSQRLTSSLPLSDDLGSCW